MAQQKPVLDRHWHLGANDDELAVADFEYALMRSIESYNAWQQECLAAVSGQTMSATDNVILHVSRMNDRPKSISELSVLLNRTDLSNLKYSVRKLVQMGLLEKISEGNKRKGTRYQATAAGIEITEAYARLRREQLMPVLNSLVGSSEKLQQATQTLNLVSGIYEQNAHQVAFHRGPVEGDD